MGENRTVVSLTIIRKFLEERIETKVIPTTLTGSAVLAWADTQIKTLLHNHSSHGQLPRVLQFLMPDPTNSNHTVECTIDISQFTKDTKTFRYLMNFLPGFFAELGALATVYGTMRPQSMLFSIETPSSQRLQIFCDSTYNLIEESVSPRSSSDPSEMFSLLAPRVPAVKGLQ